MAVSFRTTVPTPSLEEAYAACKVLAQGHYENFSIASRLVPPDIRQYLYAI